MDTRNYIALYVTKFFDHRYGMNENENDINRGILRQSALHRVTLCPGSQCIGVYTTAYKQAAYF